MKPVRAGENCPIKLVHNNILIVVLTTMQRKETYMGIRPFYNGDVFMVRSHGYALKRWRDAYITFSFKSRFRVNILMSRYRVRLKCWVKVWNNSQPLISWRIFPFFITLETIMVGFELTSFTLGVLMTFFARFANLKVWSVSPWHAAEGDTAASITLRQFPPKQSFKIHVRAYKKKGMKFQLTAVSNHYIGDGQYHFKQTTRAMTAFFIF